MDTSALCSTMLNIYLVAHNASLMLASCHGKIVVCVNILCVKCVVCIVVSRVYHCGN